MDFLIRSVFILHECYTHIVFLILFITTSVGCTCKARGAPSGEKINVDFVCETENFGSSNLTILKKNSKNTTKYHKIFTISSFLGSENIFFYFILFYLREMLHS